MADKRRMCPHCRAFITTDDKVCPYCDTPVGPRAVDRYSPSDIGGLIPAARFTTAMILLLNIGLYVACALYSSKLGNPSPWSSLDVLTLKLFGAKFGPLILREGQWWRLVTAGFLHGGLLHIGMNLWVLFDLGTQVEEVFGTRRYLVIYFVSTITGFLASTWWSPVSTSVGASAPLFGCIGAMIAFGTSSRTSMGAAIKSHYMRWAVYGLIMGLLPGMRIDNAAHIGGLAGGYLVAWIAGTPRLVDVVREKIWYWAAAGCVVLTVLCFYRAAMFLLAVQSQIR